MAEKIKIFKPKNNHSNGKWRHAGDTFREIIDMWSDAGYIEIIETDDAKDNESGSVWMYQKNDVLLYDRPNMNWLPNNMPYKIGLFGNPVPPVSSEGQINVPWIFWGRSPRLVEKYSQTYIPFDERTNPSIFVGNIENSVQKTHRMKYSSDEWKDVIEIFEMTMGNKHKYSHSEYLELLSKSKFGLSMRGYGPKCNREIELLSLGVVPLLVDGVDTTYYDPLVEGLHYFKINSPSDAKRLIENCPKGRWELMSNAGKRWYQRNCSTKGSFETTKRIVDRARSLGSPEEISCVTTMATENSYKDLQLMLYSLYQFHPTIRVIIVCDKFVSENLRDSTDLYENKVNGWMSSNAPNMSYLCIETLSQYSGMDRKEMEKKGLWLQFMLRKCDGIDYAFKNEGAKSVLFVDSDMVFLNTIEDQCGFTNDVNDFDIGRSPHHNKLANQQRFGKYNGGFLWINHHGFTDWWKYKSMIDSRFFEQASIENADEEFSTFDVPIQYNYGWWRLYECEPAQVPEREKKFRVINGILMYDGSPLRSIHTHFEEKRFIYTVKFNMFIMRLLLACKSESQKNIYNFINRVFYNRIEENQSIKNENNQMNELQKMATPKLNSPELNSSELNSPELHLIVNYRNVIDSVEQEEIDYCINANLSNPKIYHVHALSVDPNLQIPEWLSSNSKFTYHLITKRDNSVVKSGITYREAFEYANEKIPKDSVVCLSTPHIFLDHNSEWSEAKKLLNNNIVLCLSRYEFDGNESAKKDERFQNLAYAHVQNSWVFKTPFIVRDCNFKMDTITADNKISDRIKISGYIPVNSPNQFKTYHYSSKTESDISSDELVKDLKRGYYLLPDIDVIKSIDKLVDNLGLGPVQKYNVICDIMSKYINEENIVTLKKK